MSTKRRFRWLRAEDIDKLVVFAERGKHAIAHMSSKHFEKFFEFDNQYNLWCARCKICGEILVERTDCLLLDSVILHLIKHIDEFVKIVEMLYYIQKEVDSDGCG